MKIHFALAAFALAAVVPANGEESAPNFLTLADAQAMALRNHPRFAAAQLRTLLAAEEVKETRAGFFPTATAYADAVGVEGLNTRILAGGINNPSVFNRVADGLAVTQLITDFGHTSNLTAGSKLEARAEDENAVATRDQILLDVDIAYFGAQRAQTLVQVARQTLDTRELLVRQVTALAENKLKSELDVSFAQVALEEARLLEQQVTGDADTAMATLSTALGYREQHFFQLTDPPRTAEPAADVSTLIQDALRDRPDLLRLRYERDASKRLALAARDMNYPTLAAVGMIGNAGPEDNRLPNKYEAGGIQLTLPLFAGGAYLSRQHEAEIKANIADEELRDAEDNTSRDVRTAWVNFNTSIQRLATTEQLLKHATEAYRLADARYRIGSSSIVELSDAQLSQTTAAITEASARYATLIQRAILDYQVGVLR
jgi:outer membrane protein